MDCWKLILCELVILISMNEKLLLEFLTKVYPVKRIKLNNKFHRSIILDDGTIFYLKDEGSKKLVKIKLYTSLKYLTNASDNLINVTLNSFLGLKQ